MIELIMIVKLVVICFVLKDLASFLGELISEIKVKKKYIRLPILLLSYILTCSDKCFPFWFSLILSGDLFISACVSISINYISQFLYKYKNTYL